MPDPLLQAVRRLLLLIGFFSRLPVAPVAAAGPPDLPRAVALMPLAGLVIALPGALVMGLAGLTALPPAAAALLGIAVGGLVTGFLHEDGLSDMADGLLGGATRERRLEIMRDSRIGAFGAVALIVVLGLKTVLLAAALERSGAWPAAGLMLLAAALSRMAMVLFWAGLPPARTDGLSASIGRPDGRAVVAGLAMAVVLAVAGAMAFGAFGVLIGLGLVGAVLVGLSVWAEARIGGQTGDVLGGVQQLAEIAVLVGILL